MAEAASSSAALARMEPTIAQEGFRRLAVDLPHQNAKREKVAFVAEDGVAMLRMSQFFQV